MEALSMAKRYRSYENVNVDFQQAKQIQQSIQKIRERNSKNEKITATTPSHINTTNMLNNLSKSTSYSNSQQPQRLLNRPSTSSHSFNINSNQQSNNRNNSKSNPSILYNKLLSNQKINEINNKSSGLPSVNNNLSFNNSLNDNSAKNSSQTINNYSNQSSPINSDIFVDRLSDQRIFNRQFKIQQLSDNTLKSRTVSAKNLLNTSNNSSTNQFKLKQPLYNQFSNNQIKTSSQPIKPTINQGQIKSAKMTREEFSNYLITSRNSPNRRSNLSNISINTRLSNENNYQSSSIYFDYKQRNTNNANSANTNYFPVNFATNNNSSNNNNNNNSTRNPVSFSPSNPADDNSKFSKNITNRTTSKFQAKIENPPSVFNILSSNLKQKNNHFSDLNNIHFNRSSESLQNENYLLTTPRKLETSKSGEILNNIPEYKYRSNFDEQNNISPLPTKSPAIVNLLLNNQNKVYESTKNMNKINDLKKFQMNRVPVKFSKELLKIVKNETSYSKSTHNDNNLINEEDELDGEEEEYSEVLDNNQENYQYYKKEVKVEIDPDEALIMAAISKKCEEWLDKHVIPYLDSFSNTSSPTYNEMDLN